MTDADWEAGTDIERMLLVVRDRGSPRQHRCVHAALVGTVIARLKHPSANKLLATLDDYASGTFSRSQLARELGRKEYGKLIFDILGLPLSADSESNTPGADVQTVCFWVLSTTIPELPIYSEIRKWEEVSSRSTDPSVTLWVTRIGSVFRDVLGNPYRQVAWQRSWRTEAAVALARGMYESRDFGPMPVLADALEDAGCADPDVLAHCRGDGPHVRGCWVVDLVLGKE
jgi:hypothetical protein